MSYHYCTECGHSNGMDAPTVREVLEDNWVCPMCEANQDIGKDEYRMAMVEMLDRIESLESALNIRNGDQKASR